MLRLTQRVVRPHQEEGYLMTTLRNFIKLVGWILYVVSGLWGYVLCLELLAKATGLHELPKDWWRPFGLSPATPLPA